MDIAFAFVPFLITIVVPFIVGLLFLLIAARLVTRVVLDEIAKDRTRRGPSG